MGETRIAERKQYGPIVDYMSKSLITFSPETDITDAIHTILENKISGAPVINGTGKLVGILSEKDCLTVLIDSDYHDQPGGKGTVMDYMTRDVKTLSADQTVLDAAYAFIKSPYRRFPVLDNGRLVGQISRRDVLRAVDEQGIPTEKAVPSSWAGREPE